MKDILKHGYDLHVAVKAYLAKKPEHSAEFIDLLIQTELNTKLWHDQYVKRQKQGE